MAKNAKKKELEKNMPPKISDRTGKGRLEKGKWNEFDVIAWDFTDPCKGTKCELYRICEYRDQRAQGRPRVRKGGHPLKYKGQCGMQLRYLKNALAGVILLYGDQGGKNKKSEMVRVGYHLLPLYNQLFKFSRLEYAEKELYTLSDRGAIRINPVYKEIREIISCLEAQWTKIYQKVNTKKRGTKSSGESDEDFLDAMYEVVGANMKALPLHDDGKGDEIFEKAANKRINESGAGMDFSQGSVPDKAPKRKKPKSKTQLKKEQAGIKRSKRKMWSKKRLIKRVKKQIAEKENLKALNARIKADNAANAARKAKEKEENDE